MRLETCQYLEGGPLCKNGSVIHTNFMYSGGGLCPDDDIHTADPSCQLNYSLVKPKLTSQDSNLFLNKTRSDLEG